jgi:hypothetical protein
MPELPHNLDEWAKSHIHNQVDKAKRESLAHNLLKLRKDYENKGLCKVVSLGDACSCPLCTIDDAVTILVRLKWAFENGMMSKNLAELLIDLKKK